MSKITESVWTSDRLLIPMADVQHIEKRSVNNPSKPMYLMVVMKSTRYDNTCSEWANAIYIEPEKAESFMRDWCNYRGELDNSMDKTPEETEA